MGVFDIETAMFWQFVCDTGVATPLMFFKICLDTLVKQIMKTHGTTSFAIHTLSMEKLYEIKKGFIDHGVKLVINSSDCDENAQSINLKEVMQMDPNLKVSDYKLVTETKGKKYEVHFELFHHSLFNRCC
jgi:hypothetical protein